MRLALAALIFLAWWWSASGQPEQGGAQPHRRQAEEDQRQQAGASGQGIATPPLTPAATVPGAPQPMPPSDIGANNKPADKPDRNEERQEADLVAQGTMADAAVAMAVFTALQLIVGTFGLIALFRTLRYTREAGRAATIAADAARASVAVAQDTAKRQLRAYVTVLNASLGKPAGGNGFSVVIEAINTGASPAHGMTIFSKIMIGDYPRHIDLDFPEDVGESRVILGKDAKILVNPQYGSDLAPHEKGIILSKKSAIYVYGRIDYRDIFDAPRFTKFCLFSTGDGFAMGAFKADARDNEAS